MSDRMLQSSSVAGVAADQLAGAPRVAPSSVLDRSLASLVRVSWETVAWTLLFVVGAVARFYELGVRAMSHDESLHALYSYYLYNQGDYQHNPMMHGPLLFHVNALVYFLFGDNDATARLAPALAGLGVMWMAYLFRRYIGRTGALAAGVMVAISPSLLFHSRYIRNDIYISLFTMIWIYGAFRYLDARLSINTPSGERDDGTAPLSRQLPSRWRWLFVMMLGMAFGYICKEVHFMHGAVLGAFFAGLALWQVIGPRFFLAVAPALLAAGLGFWLVEADRHTLSLAVAGAGVAVTLALLAVWLAGSAWRALRRNDAADLAVLMVTLVMPFLAPFGHLLLGWDAMAYATTTDLLRSGALVAVMVLLSVGLAYYWFELRATPSPAPAAAQKVEGKRPKSDGPEPALQARPQAFGEGTLRFGTWAQLMGIFWLIQVLFFTTFLTNTRDGLATGIVGSLGYWLAQQEVARGGQPWYYYIMLGWLYEFLPLITSLVGAAATLVWLRRTPHWEPAPIEDLPAAVKIESAKGDQAVELLRQNRVYFVVLAIWWSIGNWLGYTAAGEKMPWLLVHIALPMCVLGGWWLGRLIRLTPWGEAREKGALWLAALAPALLLLVAALLIGRPEGGREVDAVAGVTRWLAVAAIAIGLGIVAWRLASRVGRSTTLRLVATGGVGLLFLFTVRFTYLLNYVNYDLVTEYLVYAHGSPDIKRALAEIDRISERTVGGRNIVVAYDDDSSWPLSWYMRQYPNAKFYGANPTSDSMSAPVIIVGPQNYDKVHPYVTRDYVKRTYRLVWWPDQGYFNLTLQRFIDTLRDPERMKRIFDIVFYRRYADDADPNKERDLTKWPNRHDFEMWVRRDIAEQIWDLNVTPLATVGNAQEEMIRLRTIDLAATNMYGGQYGSLPLLTPRAVAVAPDGSRVIADSGNHRIVVLDAGGSFVREFGGLCRLNEGAAGGCVDPDGSGPLALGDGQLNEPWGVAVDGEGQIYVADTWNGRIQVFAPDGAFLRKWGYFNTTNGELGDPLALFGPRGLAMDLNGNLLVADTGNKRILQFTPTGELVQQVGGGGVALGRFEEPTDVAVDPRDGSIYVADAWNRRIQKLDALLQPLAEWPVTSWGSQHLYHKPYITVAGNGDVYISDPANFRVLVYNNAGGLKAAFGSFGQEMNRFGMLNGLEWDAQTNTLLVADADNQRILSFQALP